MRLLVIGGSDAGISAWLRLLLDHTAQAIDPAAKQVTVTCPTCWPPGTAWRPLGDQRAQVARRIDIPQTHGGQPTQAASHETGP
jgi:hypothetical protein